MVPTEYFIGPDHYFTPEKPKESGKLQYTYNPSNPYPNRGGTFLGVGVGAALQNDNNSRSDQLMFETPVFQSPQVLLGPISATLYVGSNVPSTGFIICLQDVFPNGNIINIQEGGSKVDVKEGINKVDISVWPTGYQINQGHKLRAVITSSWFPRFNRNLNSGEPIFSARTLAIANQEIYFGKNPSSITLPMLNVNDDRFSEE
jgi:putative CocE/NonD family hydrolase